MSNYIDIVASFLLVSTIVFGILVSNPVPVNAAECTADCDGLEEEVITCTGNDCSCEDGQFQGDYATCQCDDDPTEYFWCMPISN